MRRWVFLSSFLDQPHCFDNAKKRFRSAANTRLTYNEAPPYGGTEVLLINGYVLKWGNVACPTRVLVLEVHWQEA